MSVKRTKWSVVVLGRWNPAIFTPAGVRSRCFKLDENTPIEVMVALDDFGPSKVRHEGLVVWADQQRFAVELEDCDFPRLIKAMTIAAGVLESLPETPVSAAGINVRYEVPAGEDRLTALLSAPVDNTFSDAGYEINGRHLGRVLSVPGIGRANIVLNAPPDGNWEVLLNYELKSKTNITLKNWLSEVGVEVEKHTRALLATVPGFTEEEV